MVFLFIHKTETLRNQNYTILSTGCLSRRAWKRNLRLRIANGSIRAPRFCGAGIYVHYYTSAHPFVRPGTLMIRMLRPVWTGKVRDEAWPCGV